MTVAASGGSGAAGRESEPYLDAEWVGGDGDGLARRLKALACTRPLHELDARKSRLDWLDASVYQMAEIGFQVIDLVTIAMDFDHGASHDQTVGRLVPFIAAQAPDRDVSEYDRTRDGCWTA